MKTLEELAKAASDLSQHFKKASAHHAAVAEAHKGLHEFVKAKHESMDDGDVHKAYFGKVAEFHKAKHELHKAHAEHLAELCTAYGGGEKAAQPTQIKAAEPPAAPAPPADRNGSGVEAMVKETTTGLVKSALQMIQTDPTVQDEIRKMVLEGVKSALGNQIVPDGARLTIPGIPENLTPIYRKGQKEIDADAAREKVAPQLQELVEA